MVRIVAWVVSAGDKDGNIVIEQELFPMREMLEERLEWYS